jgi:hypothetical protein
LNATLPFVLVLKKRLPYTTEVLNKDNEWGDVYDDTHTALGTRGFSIPPEVTNLMQMLAVPGLRIERLVACVRECRDATKEGTLTISSHCTILMILVAMLMLMMMLMLLMMMVIVLLLLLLLLLVVIGGVDGVAVLVVV